MTKERNLKGNFIQEKEININNILANKNLEHLPMESQRLQNIQYKQKEKFLHIPAAEPLNRLEIKSKIPKGTFIDQLMRKEELKSRIFQDSSNIYFTILIASFIFLIDDEEIAKKIIEKMEIKSVYAFVRKSKLIKAINEKEPYSKILRYIFPYLKRLYEESFIFENNFIKDLLNLMICIKKNLYVNIIFHLHFDSSSIILNNSFESNNYQIVNQEEINMNISIIPKNKNFILLIHYLNPENLYYSEVTNFFSFLQKNIDNPLFVRFINNDSSGNRERTMKNSELNKELIKNLYSRIQNPETIASSKKEEIHQGHETKIASCSRCYVERNCLILNCRVNSIPKLNIICFPCFEKEIFFYNDFFLKCPLCCLEFDKDDRSNLMQFLKSELGVYKTELTQSLFLKRQCIKCKKQNCDFMNLACCEENKKFCKQCYIEGAQNLIHCALCTTNLSVKDKEELIRIDESIKKQKQSNQMIQKTQLEEYIVNKPCFYCHRYVKSIIISCCSKSSNPACSKCIPQISSPNSQKSNHQCDRENEIIKLISDFILCVPFEDNNRELNLDIKKKCVFCDKSEKIFMDLNCCINNTTCCQICYCLQCQDFEKCMFCSGIIREDKKNDLKKIKEVLEMINKQKNKQRLVDFCNNMNIPIPENIDYSDNEIVSKLFFAKMLNDILTKVPEEKKENNEFGKINEEIKDNIILKTEDKSKQNTQKCEACLKESPKEKMITSKNCALHFFHKECLLKKIDDVAKINGKIDDVKCNNCNKPISEEIIKELNNSIYEKLKSKH